MLAAEGEVNALRLMLSNRNASHLVHERDKHGRVPLHFATKSSTVQVLLGFGAQVNAKDNSGSTPLTQCVLSGHVEASRALMDGGSTVESSTLFQATLQKSVVLVTLLLPRVSALEALDGQNQTALHLTAIGGDVTVAQLLLDSIVVTERKKFIDQVDRQSQSALHKAARRGNSEMCSWLCAHGANVDSCDSRGATARDLAQQGGFTALVAELQATEEDKERETK
jgi:ankyrin repeat protein